jgi:hypothetical protein
MTFNSGSPFGLRDPRMLRSVHLEREWIEGYDPASFVLGAAAVDLISQITSALDPAKSGAIGRSFTVTGPYGTGKSALTLYLTELLCGPETRRSAIREALTDFRSDIQIPIDTKSPFLPILVTCSGRSLEETICQAISLAASGASINLSGEKENSVNLLKSLTTHATKKGFAGICIVLDELGKALEFAARNPLDSDIYLLQQLAETANRSSVPTILIGVLHQAFGDYVDEFDQKTKAEWTKVQGRFTDIPYLPSEALLARLISDSIGCANAPDESRQTFEKVAREICELEGMWATSLDADAFAEMCIRAFPLHPTVLAVMPILMRRLGQNERSVFAFLAERGLFSLSKNHEPIRLDMVFDYMADWVGYGLRKTTGSRAWRLACEILDSRSGLSKSEVQAIKTIGLIMSISSTSQIKTSVDLISLSLSDNLKPDKTLLDSLTSLRRRSIVSYRRYNNSYILWQGSDIDVEAELEKGRKETKGRTNLATALTSLAPLPNLIARKHSFETGTLRWYSPIYVDTPETLKLPETGTSGADGIFVICLGATEKMQDQFEAVSKSSTRRDVVFAISHRIPHLKSLIEELSAMNWIDENNPGLRDDRIAREELAVQRIDLTSQIRREVTLLTSPNNGKDQGCSFWCAGSKLDVFTRRDLSRQLSNNFDCLFSASVLVRNELVNRRELSSAAAAARRNLIEAMMKNSELERLGIEGFPPERAMYESILRKSKIHVAGHDGKWKFQRPPEDDPCRILPIWTFIEDYLFKKFPKPVSVKVLLQQLERPPFGVIQGISPLILCAFMMVHGEEATLYREGTFIPAPSVANWELLLRRPDLFDIGGCRQVGVRKTVLELLCKRLNVETPSLLPVVRFFVRSIESLPPIARNTMQISDRALKLRETITNARSPESLVFHDIPLSLGLPAIEECEIDSSVAQKYLELIRETLLELDGVARETRKWAKLELAKVVGLSGDEAGWNQLKQIAFDLASESRDTDTRELCKRLCSQDKDESEVGAISFVAMRPIESWSDADCKGFVQKATLLTKEIQSEVVRTERNGTPQRQRLVENAEHTMQASVDKMISEGCDNALLQGVLRRLLRRLEKENIG